MQLKICPNCKRVTCDGCDDDEPVYKPTDRIIKDQSNIDECKRKIREILE